MSWQNGLQFDSNGNLLMTATPTTPITYINGIPVDATGKVVTGVAISRWQNGLPFDNTGALVIG